MNTPAKSARMYALARERMHPRCTGKRMKSEGEKEKRERACARKRERESARARAGERESESECAQDSETERTREPTTEGLFVTECVSWRKKREGTRESARTRTRESEKLIDRDGRRRGEGQRK